MPTKKKAPKKAVKKAVPLTASRAKTLFRSLNGLLADQGIKGRVHEIHLLADGEGDCPPPKQWRRVCFRDSNGEIVCEDRCV
jgi:hypothetical protein